MDEGRFLAELAQCYKAVRAAQRHELRRRPAAIGTGIRQESVQLGIRACVEPDEFLQSDGQRATQYQGSGDRFSAAR